MVSQSNTLTNFVFRNLTPEQRKLPNGLIMFSVKDKDFLGNDYIGEAFIHFKDVSDTSEVISDLPQTHLYLQRPTDSSK